MATVTGGTARVRPLAVDGYEKFLAIAAIVLLATVLVALARGYPQWGGVPVLVWAHLATILPALALTPVMLLRPRGDQSHRLLGRIWVAAMLLSAILSFGVRESRHGSLGPVHVISAYVVIVAPLIWLSARRHQVGRHRRLVRGKVTGALLIAGFFTFPFGRMLGAWLFG